VDELLKAGYVHVVDTDLKSYFDTIPKDKLLALVAGKVSDRRVLALVEAFLGQPVLEDGRKRTPEQGTPQGAVISPLLSNIYLDPLDHLMAEGGFEMVRYADDFVVLCRSPEQAAAALEVVRDWTAQAGLTLQRADRFRRIDRLRGSIRLRRGWWTAGRRASTCSGITSRLANAGPERRAWGRSEIPSGQRRGGRRAVALRWWSTLSIRRCAAGSAISSTAVRRRSASWTAGSGVDCGACCASSGSGEGLPMFAVPIRHAGPIFADAKAESGGEPRVVAGQSHFRTGPAAAPGRCHPSRPA